MHVSYTPAVSRAYRYFSKNLPGVVVEREEEPTEYDPVKPLLIIKSAGGAGSHHHQLLNARLTFETRANTMREAEQIAYQVELLARTWETVEDRVYLRSTGLPVWNPEPDRHIPAYTMTFDYDFKGVIEEQ